MYGEVDRSGDAAAVAAFLAKGGEVEVVTADSSTFADHASRIATEAGLSKRAERRLLWQFRTNRVTVGEAEAQYLPEYCAEQAEEIRRETFMGARMSGASVSEALDDANYAVNRL